jgi:hypothetical protein
VSLRACSSRLLLPINPEKLWGAAMKFQVSVLLLLNLFVFSACSSNPLTPATAPRQYNGSASVGDFLTITLDPVAQTLTYANVSNGDSGTVPYTVNPDGTFTLNDPKGNLLAAYEVPHYALLVQAAKSGPNHDMVALVTAVESGKISVSTWAGHGYNYMQFRTASGGLEVGSAVLDSQGNVSNTAYWPYGSVSQQSAFNQGGFDASKFEADPSGSSCGLPTTTGLTTMSLERQTESSRWTLRTARS